MIFNAHVRSRFLVSYIEPCQAAARHPPNTFLPAGYLLQPGYRPEPVFRLYCTKVVLLTVQIGSNIATHQRKEGGDRERFVAVAQNAVVNGMFVVECAEPGDEGVNRYHQKNANSTTTRARVSGAISEGDGLGSEHVLPLFSGFAIMSRMSHDQVKGDKTSNERENTDKDNAELVEGKTAIP